MSIANPYFASATADPALLRLKRNAAIASCSVGAVLIAAKFYAYLATNAVSMLSSLLDSCFDVFASLITLFSVMHAATPADRQHRYGHGKAEALSALAQSVFVLVTAGFLFYESAYRLFRPVNLEATGIGVGVTVLAIVLTFALLAYQRHVIAQTKSVAISGDNLHYKGDLLMNLAVIAALVLTAQTGITAIDAFFGMGIALHLLRGVWAIAKKSIDILMDKELASATRKDIKDVIARHPAAKGVHDLRTRDTGERIFIEFHLEMDGSLTLDQAHDVTEEIEKMLFDAYPASEVIIHQEPAGLSDHRLDDRVR